MASSTHNPLHNFVLTPYQQSLLFAALSSNMHSSQPPNPGFSMQYNGSPVQQPDGLASFQSSPEFDFDNDFAGADANFDLPEDSKQPKMIGDLPGAGTTSKTDSADAEFPEKRSRPDDGENSGAKRRESEEKVAKKPGRKPLTTEPSSKRKAQNRAAQRAFRERKEKHLRDLENKVQELEKASQAANNENEALRAQIDRLTMELNEYKKRLSLLSGGRPAYQGPAAPFGSLIVNNLNDVNFQFEFPKFGTLPGPPVTDEAKKSTSSTSTSQQPTQNGTDHRSPDKKSQDGVSPSSSSSYGQICRDSQSKDNTASASAGVYTSPLSNGNAASGSSVSLDSHYNLAGPTTTSSPSASSNSNAGGASSSCGTSPEPFTQSPMGFKPADTLATIGEEQPSLNKAAQGKDYTRFTIAADKYWRPAAAWLEFSLTHDAPELGHFANAGMVDDFTQWLPQDDFQFEPQLFGDYREPQENILSQAFDDSFFNDALDVDFTTPYNLPPATASGAGKKDLIAQIDAAKNEDDMPSGQMLNCNKIWEKLQNCPKVQSGDFDLDGLCADLQKKAKCSGSGAVVNEEDFDEVMKKYLCKEELSATKLASLADTAPKANGRTRPAQP